MPGAGSFYVRGRGGRVHGTPTSPSASFLSLPTRTSAFPGASPASPSLLSRISFKRRSEVRPSTPLTPADGNLAVEGVAPGILRLGGERLEQQITVPAKQPVGV